MHSKFKLASSLMLIGLLYAVPPSLHFAQEPAGMKVQEPAANPAPSQDSIADTTPPDALSMNAIITRIVERERQLMRRLVQHRPLVETYIQELESDEELGSVPKDDKYFLGKLDLSSGVNQKSLLPAPGLAKILKDKVTQLYSMKYLPNGFAQMIMIDDQYFTPEHYKFEFVRREFLGEVRCLVFDVQPLPESRKATFWGRIWVEDRDHSIVRFNGTYNPEVESKIYFHFDSWREQMGPGLWVPAYVYTEESDKTYFFGRRQLKFKGQTRLWGYNVGRPNQQDEFTALLVESDDVRDTVDVAEGMSPVRSLRNWERQAEDNTLNRLQKAGLLAPDGEVNKILETVITNLEVTNKLDIQPPVRARVLLTSPLESFTVGHTIVLSRGLIDVLPDEPSLAMVLAHELAHISLGHRLDTKYAFSDRMLFTDEETFRRLFVKRDQKEEQEADEKAAEFLANSPYKDKLGNAGLFLRALDDSAPRLQKLLRPHMGNRMVHDSKVRRMADLMKDAPALEREKTGQIAALPLGGRVRVNAWDNKTEIVKAKPLALLSAREKMPFELTPVFLYLTRQQTADDASQTSASKP